jgi:hypothetical protein
MSTKATLTQNLKGKKRTYQNGMEVLFKVQVTIVFDRQIVWLSIDDVFQLSGLERTCQKKNRDLF